MQPCAQRFKGAGGLVLAADVWGDSAAPPVLLLHGGGQTRHSWQGTSAALARDGWYAVALDLRGHGDSDWAPDGAYHFEAFADDVLGVVATFEQRPVIVGASLGGLAALLAESRSEAPLSAALVLVDIAPRIEPGGASRIVAFMKGRPEGFASVEEAADAIAQYNPHRARPHDLSGLEKNLRRDSDGRYRWHWDPKFLSVDRREPRYRESLNAAARRLTVPTLLVRGRSSDLLSEKGARAFLDLVPHAHYVDVSGAGHMVAGDRNDAFTDSVLAFLRDRVPH